MKTKLEPSDIQQNREETPPLMKRRGEEEGGDEEEEERLVDFVMKKEAEGNKGRRHRSIEIKSNGETNRPIRAESDL